MLPQGGACRSDCRDDRQLRLHHVLKLGRTKAGIRGDSASLPLPTADDRVDFAG